MKRFKCQLCGYIYEEKEPNEFEQLDANYICPKCGGPKHLFEEVTSEIEKPKRVLKNAIEISEDNVAITRILDKCIDCGLCKSVCIEKEGILDICSGKACVNCGQCILKCPTNAIIPKPSKDKFLEAKKKGKVCIAYTSPSIRVSLGEGFGMEKGSFVQGKMITALRKLGFDYVLDVTFGADLTIIEEANEFVERLKNNQNLPMFTSCCPAWIKYAEQYYPEILSNISTCKSPIGMQGAVVENYFLKKHNLKKEDVFTVAITPCTAKKYEISKEEITGTDCVITTAELIDLIKEQKIDFNNLEDGNYDSLLQEGSGAGVIFGVTGGVMEAALRTTYFLITNQELPLEKLEFKSVRGMNNIKETTVIIENKPINIAVIHKMADAQAILEQVKNKTSKYHYIEIMNCEGGCIGGGGQPKLQAYEELEGKSQRIESLYKKDQNKKIRVSHQNQEILQVYKEYLQEPLSKKAEEILHTTYQNQKEVIANKQTQEV